VTREIIENDTSSLGVAESPVETPVAYGGSTDYQIYEQIVSQLKTYSSPGNIEGEEVDGKLSEPVIEKVSQLPDVESSISSARGIMIRLTRIRGLSNALTEEEEA